MHDKSFNDLVNFAMEEPFHTRKLKQITEENKAILPSVMPKDVHVPDENELREIAYYMANFKKQFPNASKRQIRKAAQEHFSVRVFRKPYKIKQNASN